VKEKNITYTNGHFYLPVGFNATYEWQAFDIYSLHCVIICDGFLVHCALLFFLASRVSNGGHKITLYLPSSIRFLYRL